MKKDNFQIINELKLTIKENMKIKNKKIISI